MRIMRYESFIAEAIIDDPKVKNEISRFYDLQRRIKELEAELEASKSEFKEFEIEMRPMMDGMKEVGDKLAKTEEFIIEITRFGGERKDASYKNAFEMALSKVNGATKKILQESFEASKKVTQIKHSFTIDKITEASVLGKIGGLLKKAVVGFISLFKKESKVIDRGNDELENIAANVNEDFINEGVWAKMMKGVRSSETGPWSLVAIENRKVVGQKIDIKTQEIIPAHYEAMKREYPKAKIHIEDGTGAVVWNESISMDAVYIHQITGSGQDAAQNFIDDNKLDSKKLANYVKMHQNSKEIYDVRDYIAGTGVGAHKNLKDRFIKDFKRK
jgi:hypothetical protein